MTRIVLIRHGEATAPPERICGRSNHFPLTPLGEQQAAAVDRALGTQPNAIWASPALRTRQTAQLALEAAGIDLPVIIEDDLQELNQASFEGLVRTEVFTPERIAERDIMQLDFALPGAESLNQLADRTKRALGKIATSHPDQTVWTFGHRMSTKSVVGSLLGWDYKEVFYADCPNVSATTFEVDDSGITLVKFAEELIGSAVN